MSSIFQNFDVQLNKVYLRKNGRHKKIEMPNLVPRVRFSFGQHREHGLSLVTSKTGSLLPRPQRSLLGTRLGSRQIMDFRVVYARSENLNNCVCQGYENGPSLRLRINWNWPNWPESVFSLLTKRKADSRDEIGKSQARTGSMVTDGNEVGKHLFP